MKSNKNSKSKKIKRIIQKNDERMLKDLLKEEPNIEIIDLSDIKSKILTDPKLLKKTVNHKDFPIEERVD